MKYNAEKELVENNFSETFFTNTDLDKIQPTQGQLKDNY